MDSNIERWRGTVESELKTYKEWTERFKSAFDELTERERKLEIRIEHITTKLTIFAALCGFVGGGIVSLITAFIFGKHN
jgi:butyrate kinase